MDGKHCMLNDGAFDCLATAKRNERKLNKIVKLRSVQSCIVLKSSSCWESLINEVKTTEKEHIFSFARNFNSKVVHYERCSRTDLINSTFGSCYKFRNKITWINRKDAIQNTPKNANAGEKLLKFPIKTEMVNGRTKEKEPERKVSK